MVCTACICLSFDLKGSFSDSTIFDWVQGIELVRIHFMFLLLLYCIYTRTHLCRVHNPQLLYLKNTGCYTRPFPASRGQVETYERVNLSLDQRAPPLSFVFNFLLERIRTDLSWPMYVLFRTHNLFLLYSRQGYDSSWQSDVRIQETSLIFGRTKSRS